MDEEKIPELTFKPNTSIRTYLKCHRKPKEIPKKFVETENTQKFTRNPLTTKKALEFLLEGRLNNIVCRFCLNETSPLSELDQILQIAGEQAIYKVTIRDMIASFHPYKVTEDPNFPTKICNKCLEKTITSYLFTQQCEQAERAMRNCFEDMYDKLEKLDPLDPPKKRGRQKLHPNCNKLFTEHKNVINYAEPLIQLVHTASESFTEEAEIKDFECLKCSQVLLNIESLLNHEKSHPASMWFNCRLCGKSFPKGAQLKRHFKVHEKNKPIQKNEVNFKCNKCGDIHKDYNKYIQHLEKHKFKTIMEHLIEKKMDRLCTVCLDKSPKMTALNNEICLHGGYPELRGNRNIYNILQSTLPNINNLNELTGSIICDKCLNNSIISYIFIQQFNCNRRRLSTCLDLILEGLKKIIKEDNNVVIEISPKVIMELDDRGEVFENDFKEESKPEIEILEDEFRISEFDVKSYEDKKPNENDQIVVQFLLSENNTDTKKEIFNKPSKITKTGINNFTNGYQNSLDNVSEFLSFKDKKKFRKTKSKFRCPLCSKHFISGFYLRRHIPGHFNSEVYCNICNIDFKSNFALNEHFRMIHALNFSNYYNCSICARCFKGKNKLALHKNSHFKIKCDLCDKIFKNQNYFNNHMQRHSIKLRCVMEKNTQTCSLCDKKYLTENALSRHVNKVHLQIKPYSCDMCEANFYTEMNLKNHKTIHSLYSKEICEFCKKTLKSRKLLVIHLRKHLGVMPNLCQFIPLTV